MILLGIVIGLILLALFVVWFIYTPGGDTEDDYR